MRPSRFCFLCHVFLELSLAAEAIIYIHVPMEHCTFDSMNLQSRAGLTERSSALCCTGNHPFELNEYKHLQLRRRFVQDVVGQEIVEEKGLCTTLSSLRPTLIVSGPSLECPRAKIQEGSIWLL